MDDEITISKLEYEMLVQTILLLYSRIRGLENDVIELKSRVEVTAVQECDK